MKFDLFPIYEQSVPIDFSGNNKLGIHAKETTQRHAFGRRYIDNLGKVYRYGKSGGACYTGRGNVFYPAINDATGAGGIDYAVLAAAAAAGDTVVKMTNTGSAAIAEDFLVGGQILIKPTETVTDAQVMERTVIANSYAAATSGVCSITLSAPLETAVTTSNYAFVMPSHWTDVRYANVGQGGFTFAGLAATYISASGYYFWTQVYGPCWICPQASMGGTVATYGLYRTCYWRHDGSIDYHGNIGSNVTDQIAGYILDNNASANGSTVIMLTCDK